MNHLIGQQFGNYRITRQLGDGGSAEVYLAEHIHLKTQAAIKLLHPGKMTEENIRSFQAEARTIASLKHPHILRLLEFGFQDTMPFLVMEYAPGGTLRDLYPAGSRLQAPLIVSFVKPIASALAYAHSNHLIHRDIKPENMLIDVNKAVQLSDFGIVALAHGTNSMKTVGSAGTIYYMAPEQINGKPRRESDQYALGVVVYEWLCGERPFTGTYPEIVMKHLSQPPPSLRTRGGAVSAEVEQVLNKVLAKEPQQRYPDILAFAQALEQALQPAQTATFDAPTVLSQKKPSTPKETVHAPQTPQASQIAIAQLQAEGEVLFSHGRYAEALSAFEQILKIDASNIDALSWKGAALDGMGQYVEALAAREQAIRNGSTYKEDYQGKGGALYQLERYGEAIQAFDQALQIDPQYIRAYSWKAAALYKKGQYVEALEAREQAIRNGSTYKEDYQGKGEALYQLERYDEAIQAFDQALQIDPQYIRAYSWKAAVLYKKGQYVEALEAREQAIRNGSTYKEDYQGKGEALYQLERYDEAIQAFDQALQIDPQYIDAYTWRAKAVTQRRIAQQNR